MGSRRLTCRRKARSAVLILLLAAGSLASATPVSAHLLDRNQFSGGGGLGSDLVGTCGQTRSGWVMAVQGNLVSHFRNLGTGGQFGNGIDGQFGQLSYTGVKEYQQIHGLTQDGCVGPLTWNKMVDATHRSFIGRARGFDYYEIRPHGTIRAYRYRADATCGGTATDNFTGMTASDGTTTDNAPNGRWKWVDHQAFGVQSAPCA